jgi:prepilin-type N-terminal cleavage/methylation domain-containing protein
MRRLVSGFTLIEMVVTIVLMGVLLALGAPLIASSVRAFNATSGGLHTLSKLRFATERLAREIREVQRNPSAPDEFHIIGTPTATSLVFNKYDYAVDDTVRVSINQASASDPLVLSYQTSTASDWNPAVSATLADQVELFEMKYYGADGQTETADKSLVRYVQVTLHLAYESGSYPQSTRIALRNRQ